MKKCFCEKMNIEESTIRIFLNGERLENKQIIKELKLNANDVIEAFREISGGGPPQKKNKTFDDKQILEALNKSSDYDESEDTNAEKVEAKNGQEINKHEHFDDDKMKDLLTEENDDLSEPKDEETFSSGHRKECHEDGKLDLEETEQENLMMNQNYMDLVKDKEKKKNKLKSKEISNTVVQDRRRKR